MRFSFLLGLAVGALAQVSGANAQITLTNSPDPSFVQAGADGTGSTMASSSTSYVTTLPYATPTSITDGTSVSTIAPFLSATSLTFSFTQSNTVMGAYDQGVGVVYFTPQVDLTYSISGTVATSLSLTSDVLLTDETTNQSLYSGSFAGTQLNAGGTASTGTLIAGDRYVFEPTLIGTQGGATPGVLTGSVSLNLVAAPEPPTWMLFVALAAGMAVFRWRQAHARQG
jgi:hypothetical protein